EIMQAPVAGKALIAQVQRTQVPIGCLAIWFLGQASVIVKGAGVTVYIDPYFSDFAEKQHGIQRLYPQLLQPEEIVNADLCLITHEHDDHLDQGTIPAMVRNRP